MAYNFGSLVFAAAPADKTFFGVLMYVIAIVVIVVLAYFTTRFVGKVYSFGFKSRYLKLVDRVTIPPDKMIVLVEFADKLYLLASDKSGVSLIDTLDPEIIKTIDSQNTEEETKSFLDFLNVKRRK